MTRSGRAAEPPRAVGNKRGVLWPLLMMAMFAPGCMLAPQILWRSETAVGPTPGAIDPDLTLAEPASPRVAADPRVHPAKAPDEPVTKAQPDDKPESEPTPDAKPDAKPEDRDPDDLPPLTRPRTAGETPTVPTEPMSPAVPAMGGTYPIDLSTALRLAAAENPQIAEARSYIGVALADLQGARALMLPTLNIGTNYHGHTGNLQRSSGHVLNLSEQSLYFGGGARTLAAESVAIPAINIVAPLADTLYAPLAARQALATVEFNSTATTNDVLREVADQYLELLGAQAALAAERQSEAEANDLAKLTANYTRVGLEQEADAHRAGTEDRLRRLAIHRAEEAVAVASARLSRRLHLDPSVRLAAPEGIIEPLSLVDLSSGREGLIRTALGRRPELGARGAAIALAETRLRQEYARPFLPFVWVGSSGGGFGGGSNLVPPYVGNFRGRTDFDVRVFWTLQNFGLGNLAQQKRRRAQVGQAAADRARLINQVRREVMNAYALCLARREQVTVGRLGLRTAEAGFREDLARIRGAVGMPIEATNSLELLADARQNFIRSLIELNQAEFALYVALGSPPPAGPPPAGPTPAPPLASPPVGPMPLTTAH